MTGPALGKPGVHLSASRALVEQYLGSATPSLNDIVSAEGALKRGAQLTAARASRQAVNEERAASVIQRSFRLHRQDLQLRKRSFSKLGHEALELISRYLQLGPDGLLKEDFGSRARLVLHFDINKTIIMTDMAQDASTDHMINVLLSECAWGRLEAGPRWEPVGRLATDRPANDPQLMSYRSYLDSFLLPFVQGQGAEADAQNTQIKNRRQHLKRQFTELGQPGEMFRGVFTRLKAALAQPEGCCSCRLFASGERRILPSFFKLLMHLHDLDREFSIIFRSFGSDIADVVEEMNMFCTGQHPCYPQVRMDGSQSRTDLRMSIPESTGAFFRSTSKPDGSILCLGAPTEVMKARQLHAASLQAQPAPAQVMHDFKAMYEALMTRAKLGNRALALRDYYQFWKSRNERSRAGKLLLLDRSDPDIIQIFFDDNIGYGSAHIVDVRDVSTGAPIAFQDVNGKHLMKCEPLNAILDVHYFVRAVHECVLAVRRDQHQPLVSHRHQPDGTLVSAAKQPGALARRLQPSVSFSSRRGRELWDIVNQRLVMMIRIRNMLQQDG
ncbi:hypothetical protein WJX72_007430 [[Myrmecia] bisecta]|uniref:Uncharacterized protein n=1 Tax=[Myrmecia] bisecta TaxID=41462 RepID=A0AAW1QFQ0_9CHLO